MPIYEYTCRECGKQFEQLVRGDSTPECPACQSTRLEKMLSAFAVSSGNADSATEETCGRCGNAPGSCMMN
jgi:putative FmdB family regulatory protein